MKELKDYDIMDIEAMDDERLEKSESGKIQVTRVYIKSEADKVIAELKHDVEMWIGSYEASRRVNARTESELRYHKYKRCQAMAKYCKDKVDAIKNGYMRSSIESRDGVMTTCPPECNPKFSFYDKWRNRWLKIAEQFKEAK